MKSLYWLISGLVVLSAVIGTAVAVNRQSGRSPSVETAQPADSQSVTAQPTRSLEGQPVDAQPTISQPDPVAQPVTPEPQPLTNRSPVSINGIGPVVVGMTIEEASRAAGVPIVTNGVEPSEGCSYAKPQSEPEHIGFMVTEGHISRVDIFEDSPIKTRSGLGIGSTEAEIIARFPGQIEITPHAYTDGHYLTFTPNDPVDRNYRIIFETDNQGRVTQFRAGKLSEVTWVEGCA